jgi:hypothetical protein
MAAPARHTPSVATRRATFRFYAGLNDFLPPRRRGVSFEQAFCGAPTVKDLIEAQGVPHPEVDLVLADGEPVDFGWAVEDGARVSVYPAFVSIDVAPLTRVRPPPLEDVRFVLDGHLGRLARYLRMAGFDALWQHDARDEELARASSGSRRILVTRDLGLLKRREVSHGYWVRATDPAQQLGELVRRFDLSPLTAPFQRCLRCNTRLEPVAKAAIAERLPPRVRERHDAFTRCPSCDRLYWPGTHQQRMTRLLESALL